MKKLNRKTLISLSTNLILGVILCTVFLLGFTGGGVVSIYGERKNEPIYRGNTQSKKISLMFNVYENTEIVNSIIDTLDGYKVKATFFVGGCWADDNEITLKKIVSSGHEIANHGYFHKDHKDLSYENNVKEIKNTNVVVESLCGVMPVLFAPPSGSFSDVTLCAAEDLGMKTVMWSKDTIDWRDKDINKIISRATKNLAGGDLILMHPKAHTLSALPKIIEYAVSNGFIICSVSENLL